MQNPIRHPLLAAGFLCMIGVSSYAADRTHPELRGELLTMAARDQEVRRASKRGDFSKWQEVDHANQARLKQIVDQFGWPTYKMVGVDGARAAWLLAQHADSDEAFQRKVLAMMAPLVARQQASGTDYAYLYDRTHYPQRFGTQGNCVSRQEWQPFKIEDIDKVDERRRAVNLPPLAKYAKVFDCANPNIALHSAADSRKTVPVPRPDLR
ncbi:DUF6624 domain-containing protein [Massilia soli]|uniref:Uncharacterized protein n=1 Tax=Massilia soli TaxID=2792854 RepID=A0ABS7SVP4_9BURK|nr:DUF6624 domain-containing protein [Massilia soli]MBZ2209985.1 hypothetical protein [Massilia soli]